MKAALLVLLLVTLVASRYTRVEHDYWYTANRKSAESGVPYADVAWSYCDMKCLYFENLYQNADFYVINFKDAVYKPNFSACYARVSGGSPQLWNKVAENGWYEANCGNDG